MFRFHDNAAFGHPTRASLWMPAAGLDRVRWLAGPHSPPIPPPSPAKKPLPHLRAQPRPSPPVCLHGPSVSPPCPPQLLPAAEHLPLPPSCLQRDSWTFRGASFSEGLPAFLALPPPTRSSPFSPAGIQRTGIEISSLEPTERERVRPLLRRTGQTPLQRPP